MNPFIIGIDPYSNTKVCIRVANIEALEVGNDPGYTDIVCSDGRLVVEGSIDHIIDALENLGCTMFTIKKEIV